MDAIRPYARVLEQLRGVGLRPTRQRMALAKLLFENEGRHITAEMLHAEAQSEDIRVSLATIYNTLHQFTRAGLLKEIVVDSQRSYFDTTTHNHHHFFNEKTATLTDIPDDMIEFTKLPEAPEGLKVKQVDVIVRVE